MARPDAVSLISAALYAGCRGFSIPAGNRGAGAPAPPPECRAVAGALPRELGPVVPVRRPEGGERG